MRSIVFEGDTWERYEDLRRSDHVLHRVLCRQLKEMQRGDPAAGATKIVVDYLNITPTELAPALDKAVLTPLALEIVCNLIRC